MKTTTQLTSIALLTALSCSVASAANVTFTGADAGNNLFSDADNWDVFPSANDTFRITPTATSLSNPGQVDALFSTKFGNAFVMPSTDGTAYIEVLSGAAWESSNLTLAHGNVGLTQRHAVMTLKSGSSLSGNQSSGTMTIGAGTGGSTGRLAAEDGVTMSFSELTLQATGTMAFEFGSASVSTFTSSKSNGAATMLLDGIVEVDLDALDTVGAYTLFTGSHASTVLSGALMTDLTNAGGSIVSSATSTHFNVLNEGAIDWSLTLSGNDLVLSVAAIPEPGTYALLAGCFALASVMIRRRR